MSEAFDLIAFRDFCAGKPARRRYDYTDNNRCPIAQFITATMGVKKPRVCSISWWNGSEWVPTPGDADRACNASPATFGALASRLSALIREGGNV